jgi:hypothetical protein
MTDQKSIENLENTTDIKDKVTDIESMIKNAVDVFEKKYPQICNDDIDDAGDWRTDHLEKFETEDNVKEYLIDFSEGKYSNDEVIPTLLLLKTKYADMIESFLKDMKVDEKTNLGYLKEYIRLIASTISCGDKNIKKELILDLKKTKPYKQLLESNETKVGAHSSMMALLTFEEMNIDDTDIIDMAKNNNLVMLSLLDKDRNKCLDDSAKLKILKKSVLDGNIIGCIAFVKVMTKYFHDMSSKYNNFTVSCCKEFKIFVNFLPVLVEIENVLQPKSSFLNGIADFIAKYYDASMSVRSFTAGMVAKILMDKTFSEETSNIAYSFLHKIVDGTDVNISTHYENKKNDPTFFLLLETAIENIDKFIEICETIHKNRCLTKDISTIISLIMSSK